MKTREISGDTLLAAKAGDVAARNEIIEAHMGLIASAAQKATRGMGFNRGHSVEDRIQDGVIYMAWIIENFNAGLGTPFVVYAERSLLCHMAQKQDEDTLIVVTRNQGLTRKTRPHRDRARRIDRLPRNFTGESYRTPVDEEIQRLPDVKGAIGRMSGMSRKAVVLRLAGATFQRIGDECGCSHVSALNYFRRGILHLQTVLKA